AGQAVVAGVGDAHGVVDVVERDHGEHRPEDLLLGDAHLVVHVGEDGGLHVPALLHGGGAAVAADDDPGALLLAEGDVLLDPLLLALGDERADLGGGVVGIAHGHAADRLGQRLDDLVVARPTGEDAGLDHA